MVCIVVLTVNCTAGWSFEIDEDDVNQILNMEEGMTVGDWLSRYEPPLILIVPG